MEQLKIYERIRIASKSKGLSIRELERQLRFSNGTIQHWLDSAPSKKLKKVSNRLHLTIDYLAGNYQPNASSFKDSDLAMILNDLRTLNDLQIEAIRLAIKAFKEDNKNESSRD